MKEYSIMWFRRDLRLFDNAAFYHALKSPNPVKCIFIFDNNILDKLENKEDPRVEFIFDTLLEMKKKLQNLNSDLEIYYGNPRDVWTKIMTDNIVKSIFTNRDYETYAISRDKEIANLAESKNIIFNTSKDHVIFEKNEVLKDDGDPYVVFTPYKRKWLAKLQSKPATQDDQGLSFYFKSYPCSKYYSNLYRFNSTNTISLENMGFEHSKVEVPPESVPQKRIRNYDETRDYPAIKGTSKLGIHFRFGTISIRQKARKAKDLNDTYLSELVWRDFYSMILQSYPKVEDQCFREKYEHIEWRNNEEEFKAWCNGVTGYPIVDAGMRELNNTGYMHNRVRMITASFLTKHLLIDWRWGERYFAEKLLDYDLASNSGGWQWAAGCGTDAAPYFRIFNPYTQANKFDKDRKYIKEWVPEIDTDKYPEAIVDHKEARERCLSTYKRGLDRAAQ